MAHIPKAALRNRNRSLERPIDSAGWLVPERVWLKHGRGDETTIAWEAKGTKIVGASDGMLRGFLDLDCANPDCVAKYIKKWGALSLRLPEPLSLDDEPEETQWWELPRLDTPDITAGHLGLWDSRKKVYRGEDHLSYWLHWQGRFRAALRVWECIREDREPKLADRTILTGGPVNALLFPDFVPSHLTEFCKVIDGFVQMSGVGFGFVPDNERKTGRVELRSPSVFTGLVMQLAAACGPGYSGYSTCSLCGVICPQRKRHPRTHRGDRPELHYCGGAECMRRAAAEAVRRCRSKKYAK